MKNSDLKKSSVRDAWYSVYSASRCKYNRISRLMIAKRCEGASTEMTVVAQRAIQEMKKRRLAPSSDSVKIMKRRMMLNARLQLRSLKMQVNG